MLRSLIVGLTGVFASSSPSPTLPKHINYVTFEVRDEAAAKALYDWYIERTTGLKEIEQYVRENFTLPLMKKECPYYYLDNDGRLEKVHYTGHVPDGWGGIPDTHWLEPKTADARKDVDTLPKPSLTKLHEIANWPTLEEKWFHAHEQDVIRGINHMIRVYNDGQVTYIDVPHPDNFLDFPRIHSQLTEWQKPSCLAEVTSGIRPTKQMVAAV